MQGPLSLLLLGPSLAVGDPRVRQAPLFNPLTATDDATRKRYLLLISFPPKGIVSRSQVVKAIHARLTFAAVSVQLLYLYKKI